MIANTLNKIQEVKNWVDEKISEAFCIVAHPVGLIGLGYIGASAARVGFNMIQNGPFGQGQEIASCLMLMAVSGIAAYQLKQDDVKGTEVLVGAGVAAGLVAPPAAFII